MTPATPSSALAVSIAACADMNSLIGLFDAFTRELGAHCVVWYSLDSGIEAAAADWTPVYSTFRQDIARFYAENRCMVDDPIIRAAAENDWPVRYLDQIDNVVLTPSAAAFYERAIASGIVDALALNVADRPGRLVYICLAFTHSLENLSAFDRRRVQACAEMFVRHAASLGTGADGPRGLSPRERSVVAYLARGASNKEIARRLGLSIGTVNTMVNRCFEKLGASTRAQAAIAAARNGLAMVA